MKIFRFLVVLTLTWSFPANAYQVNVKQGSKAAKEGGGGADGGGGDLIEKPADPSDYMSRAKLHVLLYFNARHINYLMKPEPDTIDSVLFSEPNSVFALIKKVKIENLTTTPCKDQSGNDSDGSYRGSVSDPAPIICLSSFRMKSRLSDLDAESQTASLIVHELAHLMKLDPPFATYFQKQALNLFPVVNWKVLDLDIFSIEINMPSLPHPSYFSLINLKGRCRDITQVTQYYLDFDRASRITRDPRSTKLYALSGPLYRDFQDARVRLEGLRHFVCSKDPVEPDDRRQQLERDYNYIFQGSNSVTPIEYVNRSSHSVYLRDMLRISSAQNRVFQIFSDIDLKSELQFVSDVLDRVYGEIVNLEFIRDYGGFEVIQI